MTSALFTTDTEMSFMLFRKGLNAEENFRVAVMGKVADGEWGIGHQMRRLGAHGLKGVFFVEALSSHLFGLDSLKRVVDPILTAGHEVQLHLHTEWLKWIEKDLVGARRGANIADFSFEDQRRLLELGVEALEAAGAPRPVAFRAGNYGAGNETLKALASLGIVYDSSYNEPYRGGTCRIRTDAPLNRPVRLDGLVEVPITWFEDYPGHTRALQVCAASAAELETVARQSLAQRRPTIVVVSHCFELLNQKRTHANRLLVKRFDDYCAFLQSQAPHVASAGFRDLEPGLEEGAPPLKLTSNPVRTALRMIEQTVGTVLYDRG